MTHPTKIAWQPSESSAQAGRLMSATSKSSQMVSGSRSSRALEACWSCLLSRTWPLVCHRPSSNRAFSQAAPTFPRLGPTKLQKLRPWASEQASATLLESCPISFAGTLLVVCCVDFGGFILGLGMKGRAEDDCEVGGAFDAFFPLDDGRGLLPDACFAGACTGGDVGICAVPFVVTIAGSARRT